MKMNEISTGLTYILLLPSAIPTVGSAALLRRQPAADSAVSAPSDETLPGRIAPISHINGSVVSDGELSRRLKPLSDSIDLQPPTAGPLTTRTPARPNEAVVDTYPELVHPAFTTYLFSVTLPCVLAWVLVTWLCLWICRPHSPLYREILKRLIEHSQMKQKSVLFAATVLAGERKPPEEHASESTSTA